MDVTTCGAPGQAAAFTTYRVGGPIDNLHQPETPEQAAEVLRQALTQGAPVTILGWGSNVIVASAGIRGVTLVTRKLAHTRVEPESRRLIAGAGVHLARIATMAEAQGWTGAEFMIGIPATIGGAARMNAGAMGQETASVIDSVLLFDAGSGEITRWPREPLQYAYRHSALQAPAPLRVVLEATLVFEAGDPAAIRAQMETNVSFRKTHHPTEPNGGSVFETPSRKTLPMRI